MLSLFTFKKEERLCSRTLLGRLFTEGKSVFSYPFKFIYLPSQTDDKIPVKVVFSVPKRSFKKAVTRNLIRRRMREVYRLNKHILYNSLIKANIQMALMIIYIEKDIPDYSIVETGILKGFKKVTSKIEAGNKTQ